MWLVHWDDPEGWDGEGVRSGGSGWGTHVNPWLIHVSVWQKPLQYCKVISLQLIKINEKKKEVVVQDIQAGFRKGRGTRDQIASIHRILEKSKRIPKKLLLLKPLTVGHGTMD